MESVFKCTIKSSIHFREGLKSSYEFLMMNPRGKSSKRHLNDDTDNDVNLHHDEYEMCIMMLMMMGQMEVNVSTINYTIG